MSWYQCYSALKKVYAINEIMGNALHIDQILEL